MADIHDRITRSYNMSQVRSKNTKPEILVRKFLFSKGLRYRIHVNKLFGKPDIVFNKAKTVIFIHGCFWHGHEGCKYFVVPKTRTEWWQAKIEKNKQRDKKNISILKKQGWKVIIVFECELKGDTRKKTLSKIFKLLSKTRINNYA